jgi:hypothetical protein
MDEMKLHGKPPTRATIIRRALRLYTRQIIQAKRAGLTQILEMERKELLKLVSKRPGSTSTSGRGRGRTMSVTTTVTRTIQEMAPAGFTQ